MSTIQSINKRLKYSKSATYIWPLFESNKFGRDIDVVFTGHPTFQVLKEAREVTSAKY